tara:strand:- start:1925 stop:2200 length:276 start_codon:yes stop_codon:yes gene_type:complete
LLGEFAVSVLAAEEETKRFRISCDELWWIASSLEDLDGWDTPCLCAFIVEVDGAVGGGGPVAEHRERGEVLFCANELLVQADLEVCVDRRT